MKLGQIISEVEFYTYSAIVRVTYEGSSANELAELLRALPGVTTVAIAGSIEDGKKETFKIKLISQKTGEEAFDAFKKNAVTKYTPIKVVDIAANTIQRK